MSAPAYKSFDQSLGEFTNTASAIPSISHQELAARITKLQGLMREVDVKAVYLDTSTSLAYFTGLSLGASERMHGGIIPSEGEPIYVTPAFEEPKTRSLIVIPGKIATWEEHEDPAVLVANLVCGLSVDGESLAFDPATPFAFFDPITANIGGRLKVVGAQRLIAQCRQIKSATEIAIVQAAMTASLQVHKAVWVGLYEGVSTKEVNSFIAAAHAKLGMRHMFAAAQFGEATAYPHGVPYDQILRRGDMVLIDLGAQIHGYCSDITRTYVFGSATERQREVWNLERKAQQAAFNAAQIGIACEEVDFAARKVLTAAGYGPDYVVPGLPHRTGHGLGMDLHEAPYIVRGNKTLLEPGMVFSVEPMLAIYGECGVRLEDIIYMTADGPVFFTPPPVSLEQPFN
ncbi:M24 family metallopeptidase [Rhizobium arsenicireducens]